MEKRITETDARALAVRYQAFHEAVNRWEAHPDNPDHQASARCWAEMLHETQVSIGIELSSAAAHFAKREEVK